MNPLSGFNKEEIFAYSTALLVAAIGHLERNEELSAEAAAWRVADALGALSQVVIPGTMGIHEKTGLGYKLQLDEVESSDDTSPLP